jgi:hypothetical protein
MVNISRLRQWIAVNVLAANAPRRLVSAPPGHASAASVRAVVARQSSVVGGEKDWPTAEGILVPNDTKGANASIPRERISYWSFVLFAGNVLRLRPLIFGSRRSVGQSVYNGILGFC